MPQITGDTRLEQVEHVLGSGTGILDLAVHGENDYYTWDGPEDVDWSIADVARVENSSEDRFIVYPEAEYFVCEIETSSGSIRCWCD